MALKCADFRELLRNCVNAKQDCPFGPAASRRYDAPMNTSADPFSAPLSSSLDGQGIAGSLQGRFLIAMPAMEDSRFAQSVVYICSHGEDGAMGLVINRHASHITFDELLSQLSIDVAGTRLVHVPIHVGGPVDSGRGFVLHSSDYSGTDATVQISDGVGLTATTDILRAIAGGTGPQKQLLALGYAGWSAGQLEAEIKANGWLVSDADPALIFASDTDNKWTLALAALGIDPALLSGDAGHA